MALDDQIAGQHPGRLLLAAGIASDPAMCGSATLAIEQVSSTSMKALSARDGERDQPRIVPVPASTLASSGLSREYQGDAGIERSGD